MAKIASGIRVQGKTSTLGRSMQRGAGSGRFVSKASAARSGGKTVLERVGGGNSQERTVVRSTSMSQSVTRAAAKGEIGRLAATRQNPGARPSANPGPHAPRTEARIEAARHLRSLRDVAGRDYLRALRNLAKTASQVEIARELGVTQPAISQALKSAARVPDPRKGFSGSDPYEIAQRYAAGGLTREQVIEELARWDYRPGQSTDGYDWTTGDVGEFNEVVGKALDDGLLEAETYDAILDRRDELGR